MFNTPNIKYDPIHEFYLILNSILNKNNNSDFCNLSLNDKEQNMKLILLNNGCGFIDEPKFCAYVMKSVERYAIYFISGAKGNDVNEFYDYIEHLGYKYLIIFVDYFKDYLTGECNNPDPLNIMGNSVYFDAFNKLASVFISTGATTPMISSSLLITCAYNKYKFAPVLVAACLLNNRYGLKEEDQSLIPYNDIMKMIKIPKSELFSGIKFK